MGGRGGQSQDTEAYTVLGRGVRVPDKKKNTLKPRREKLKHFENDKE